MDDAQFYYLDRNLDNEVYYQHNMGYGGKLKFGSDFNLKTNAWYDACRIAVGGMPIPDEDPCHDYHIYNPRYKFVDWIKNLNNQPSSTMFFSKRIIDVLKKYKIDTHKIYPTIWERRGIMIPDYYYHLQLFGDQIDNIDFENSVFDIRNQFGNHELIETNIKFKEIKEFYQILYKNNNVELCGKNVVLKNKNLDLFRIDWLGSPQPIVSLALKQELESISDSFKIDSSLNWIRFSN